MGFAWAITLTPRWGSRVTPSSAPRPRRCAASPASRPGRACRRRSPPGSCRRAGASSRSRRPASPRRCPSVYDSGLYSTRRVRVLPAEHLVRQRRVRRVVAGREHRHRPRRPAHVHARRGRPVLRPRRRRAVPAEEHQERPVRVGQQVVVRQRRDRIRASVVANRRRVRCRGPTYGGGSSALSRRSTRLATSPTSDQFASVGRSRNSSNTAGRGRGDRVGVGRPPAVFASTHRGRDRPRTPRPPARRSPRRSRPSAPAPAVPANGSLPVALSMNRPSASGYCGQQPDVVVGRPLPHRRRPTGW